ncbi:MAG: hypothetical protein WCD70_08230 [Alphaproteobacteria bacterium]
MKRLWLIAALLLAMISNAHNAAAFSIDQSSNQNTDGSAKFTDPDEKMPGFVVAPSSAGAGNGVLSFGNSGVNVPAQGENDSGAKAFDQAFSHQQDKE